MNGDEAIKFLRFLKKPISQTELQEFKELFDKEVRRVAGENNVLHGVSNNEVAVCGLELRSCEYIGFSNRCNYALDCPHKEQTER